MNILDKFIQYFYENNYFFDQDKEILFREKIEFAREYYPGTNTFLEKFYTMFCRNPEAFVLPCGVWKELIFIECPQLGIMWYEREIMRRSLK